MTSPYTVLHSAHGNNTHTYVPIQVSVYYPELAELVLVILKSALCSTTDFMQCCGMCVINITDYIIMCCINLVAQMFCLGINKIITLALP